MIVIPNEIKEFIEMQGVFAVGTIGVNKIPNISPRIFFRVDKDVIYWLDFFKHKSYKNFLENPWVSVSVFNKDDLKGYWSRRITSENRIVYKVSGTKGVDQKCVILQCRFHYED